MRGTKPPLAFRQGTPLGALSAWPAFALTHHLLVQKAARLAGVEGWFSNYAIVGDDLVIGRRDPVQYRLLLDRLFVAPNGEKSLKSRTFSCEFCSRFLWSRVDVSPISFKAVTAVTKRAELMPSLLSRLSEWRSVTLAERVRIQGWGFRSLAKLPCVYAQGERAVSRRRFKGRGADPQPEVKRFNETTRIHRQRAIS